MLHASFTGSGNWFIEDSSLQCSDFLLQDSHIFFFSACQTQLALPFFVFLPLHLGVFIWHAGAMLRREDNAAEPLESNELRSKIAYTESQTLAFLRCSHWLVCRLIGRAAGRSMGKPCMGRFPSILTARLQSIFLVADPGLWIRIYRGLG